MHGGLSQNSPAAAEKRKNYLSVSFCLPSPVDQSPPHLGVKSPALFGCDNLPSGAALGKAQYVWTDWTGPGAALDIQHLIPSQRILIR